MGVAEPQSGLHDRRILARTRARFGEVARGVGGPLRAAGPAGGAAERPVFRRAPVRLLLPARVRPPAGRTLPRRAALVADPPAPGGHAGRRRAFLRLRPPPRYL